ncbi:MAG: glucose-6-phosphate dehydrogenase assembly protein OpcA, partial [Micrococcales bacterium]|nr:glucose-6-phosphate dehydrogenase assembly protein OpcA [Micrococcales bacterium]
MIVDLPETTVGAVSKKLIQLRDEVGAMALGRVLTLVMVIDEGKAETALQIAGDATRQHPSRIVCVVTGNPRGANRIDAQIRVGGDAGASEVVILRLYGELTKHGEAVVLPLLLADSPIVAWWPFEAPRDVANDPIGQLASRRITDTEHAASPTKAIAARAKTFAPGDTDLAWSRTTKWRGLLAAALDQPPYEQITNVTVGGGLDSASSDLLAGWLGTYLDATVTRARTPAGSGLISVRLERESGPVDLVRPDGNMATLEQPGQPVRSLALKRRSDA